MNILWLSWKDETHPQAGGAELVSSEIRKRLVKDGHKVRLITSQPKGHKSSDVLNGTNVYRSGNRFNVYLKAKNLYKKEMSGWANIIIDEMNTIPFFGFRYEKNIPTALLTYQLAREVWFHQIKFPMSVIGYAAEPFYLRYMSRNKYKVVLTESGSTKKDLTKFGFKNKLIHVFRVGMHLKPVNKIVRHSDYNSVIYLGSVRPMKRTDHAIRAFELARDRNPKLTLTVVGDYSGSYGRKVFNYAQTSRHKLAIIFTGKVSEAEKQKLLDGAAVIVITSVKEGWGLIATEAASRGVPAVAYDTDGLRDSIVDGRTGVLVRSGDYNELGIKLLHMLNDSKHLEVMRKNALDNSAQYTFENSYSDFIKGLGILSTKIHKGKNE